MALPRQLLFTILLMFPTIFAHTTHSKHYANSFSSIVKNLEGYKKGQKVNGLGEVKRYLAKFGYLESYPAANKVAVLEEDGELFDEILENAIKTYQLNSGLRVTGHLDANTVKQMTIPRCGVPDIVNGTNMVRLKSRKLQRNRIFIEGTSLYAIHGESWPSSNYDLSYNVLSDTLVSGAENMPSIVSDALNKWSQVSPLTFQEDDNSNLVFSFAQTFNGDDTFDGPGGVLATSFYPTDGRSFYDNSENWSDDPASDQIDLPSVVLHEIGHLLGLGHSSDASSVMYYAIGPGEMKRDLQDDDINGIQAIYGSN